jgi:hypothetical protein
MISIEDFFLTAIKNKIKLFISIVPYADQFPIEHFFEYINQLINLIAIDIKKIPYSPTVAHIINLNEHERSILNQFQVGIFTADEIEEQFNPLYLEALNVVHLIENRFRPIKLPPLEENYEIGDKREHSPIVEKLRKKQKLS